MANGASTTDYNTEVIETQRARIQVLLARIQELESTSTVVALEREINWLEGVIYNPSYNDTDIRLLVGNTPRELRMGLTTEFPEQKIYLPTIAEKAFVEEKTASKRLRKLAATGMFSYRSVEDPETGKTRVHLAPLPPLETAPIIHIERAKEGGSTWKEGKRVKRCKDCGSDNLQNVSQVICGDCGAAQTEKVYKPVNDHSHSDADTPTDHSHSDADASAEENPECPSLRYTQGGGSTPFENIPDELKIRERFVNWMFGELQANGKLKKPPHNPLTTLQCSPTDVLACAKFTEAIATFRDSQEGKYGPKKIFEGIGWMFRREDGYTGIDLDNCRDKETGAIAAWAQEIIDTLSSYTEISPSGTGVKIWVHGSIPIDGTKVGNIEMYCHNHYFTLTGQHLPGTPRTIENRQGEIDALYERISEKKTAHVDTPPVSTKPCDKAKQAILEIARKARNGAKFITLYDTGQWESITTIDKASGETLQYYPSISEAEQGLCAMLVKLTNGDADMMDSLFRDSALYRAEGRAEKWDGPARSGDGSYGQGTIARAIAFITGQPCEPARPVEPKLNFAKHMLRNGEGLRIYCSQCDEKASFWDYNLVPYCQVHESTRGKLAS